MVDSYKLAIALLLSILLSLSFTTSASAQMSLLSASPANGALNVSSPMTFQLTFSAALDTNARFEEPDFFLNIEIMPEESLGETEEISVSSDLKTLTVSGFSLTADTRYTVFLTGAKSTSGEMLDRPYAWTFTTGASLPSGSVSGQATMDGNPANGAVVALFEELFEDDVFHLGVATPSYTIDYIPDGTYFPVSVMDSNGDGIVDPSAGDALGLYDSNGDGQPDPIEILNGNAVDGIDLNLVQPVAKTAQTNRNAMEQSAQAWASDAVLVALNSDHIAPDGQSFGWSFTFYSPSMQKYQQFFTFADAIITETGEDDHDFGTLALPENWIDSDDAVSAAEANGGSDFRTNYDDAEVYSSLDYFRLYYEDEGDQNSTSSKFRAGFLTKFASKAAQLSHALIEDTIEDLAVWRLDYNSDVEEKYFQVEINAETGALLASDVHNNLTAANQAAQDWASDSELFRVQNEWDLSESGLSVAWGFVYQSAALDSILEFVAVSGKILGTKTIDYGQGPFPALPAQFCNSSEAMVLAQQESEAFRTQHPDAYIVGELTTGFDQDPNLAVWRISYNTFSDDHFEVWIDAQSCLLATSVADDPDIPTAFALEQNYPNPFNPSTRFTYHLPNSAQVEVAVFNMLGQRAKTLVSELQPSGSYVIAWDGKNDQGVPVPTGIYIYQLKADGFMQSKKMLLIR